MWKSTCLHREHLQTLRHKAPYQPCESSSHAQPDLRCESDAEEWESMSDVSDSPDVGDVHLGSSSRDSLTREDVVLERIDALKSLLNAHPLVPRDPRNPSAPLLDMASGVRLPDVHCAFEGCVWCEDVSLATTSMGGHFHWGLEWRLFKHLLQKHADAFRGVEAIFTKFSGLARYSIL